MVKLVFYFSLSYIPRRIFSQILSSIPVMKIPQIGRSAPLQVQLGTLLAGKTGEHLIKDMVVLLPGQRSDDSRLVQEVAVDFRPVQSTIRNLNLDELTLRYKKRVGSVTRWIALGQLTILLDSELDEVFADPRDLKTVKAAAKCLKASVSGPPPATAKSCRSSSMDAWLLPEPLVPERITLVYCVKKRIFKLSCKSLKVRGRTKMNVLLP